MHISFFYSPCSLADRSESQTTMASTINSDLESISEWGYQNLVKFNASKTQFLPISLSTNPSDPQILFEDSLIEPLSSINILGVQISSNLPWKAHIDQITKSATKKIGVLFCSSKYFSPEQLFKLYHCHIHLYLEYCPHI